MWCSPLGEPDVILIGAAAVDLIARVDYLPKPDEIVLVKEFRVEPGGSTANIAVALSRLGVKCSFIGKVGDDEYGRLLIESFQREGVDTSQVIISKEGPTAKTFIAVDGKGERIIFALGGKALIESLDEVDLAFIGRGKVLYVSEAFPHIALKIMKYAKDNKVIVVYGPGGIFASMGLKVLRDIIAQSDILVLSERDLEKLIPNTASIEDSVKTLSSLGPEIVVVTLGKRGSLAYNRRENKLIFKEAFKVKAVDTTGAGDAFTAGLIFSILQGLNLNQSLTLANAIAALKVQREGPRNSPYLEEVATFLKSQGMTDLALKLTEKI